MKILVCIFFVNLFHLNFKLNYSPTRIDIHINFPELFEKNSPFYFQSIDDIA